MVSMSGDKINSLWQTMADLCGVTHFTCSILSHFSLVLCHLWKPWINTMWIYFKGRKRENTGAWQKRRNIYQCVDYQRHNKEKGKTYAFRAASMLLGLPSNHRSWTVHNGIFDHSSWRTFLELAAAQTTTSCSLLLKLSNVPTWLKHNFGSTWPKC